MLKPQLFETNFFTHLRALGYGRSWEIGNWWCGFLCAMTNSTAWSHLCLKHGVDVMTFLSVVETFTVSIFDCLGWSMITKCWELSLWSWGGIFLRADCLADPFHPCSWSSHSPPGQFPSRVMNPRCTTAAQTQPPPCQCWCAVYTTEQERAF